MARRNIQVQSLNVHLSSVENNQQDKKSHCICQQTMQGKGRPLARKRKRRTVEEVYECLGQNYFRRAYRMSYDAFRKLHNKLRPGILQSIEDKRKKYSSEKQHTRAPPIPNGPISTSVRLACALRYFAGGSPYDIAVKYGIGYSSMLDCVWHVVDAINKHKDFFISYPEDANKQRKIAAGFRQKSDVNFENCAGAISY